MYGHVWLSLCLHVYHIAQTHTHHYKNLWKLQQKLQSFTITLQKFSTNTLTHMSKQQHVI